MSRTARKLAAARNPAKQNTTYIMSLLPFGAFTVAYNDLREWIAGLDRAGELRRIKVEVDPIRELTEIADRASKAGRSGQAALKSYSEAGGPALLFENIKGQSGSKVLINQFGSAQRMKLALGVDSLDEIAGRIHQFMDVKSPQGLLDKIKMLPMLAEMGKFFPKTVTNGSCKEVIKKENASLLDFPVLQCWPKDAGRFITLPCVITRDPKTGKRNMGMYRMQIFDSKTAGMHWQRQKVGAEHYREAMRAAAAGGDAACSSAAVDIMARSSGGSVLADGPKPAGRMDVAVVIGTDPALTFSAIVPAPPDIEEYMIAGFLRQSPVELVKCETVDLEVPANAEIVLEGYVKLDELRTEGPSGDHTGFYSLADEYPVFHLTCVTHGRDRIYGRTRGGRPPRGEAGGGKGVGGSSGRGRGGAIPEIVDVNLP